VSEAETRATYDEYIAPFLRGVSSRAAKSAVCLYTCTGDARFIIDTLPEASRVMVASPCSGHAFKHSAAIGEAIAEWATFGNATTLSLEQFRFAA
jgi:sarcosine oxidase